MITRKKMFLCLALIALSLSLSAQSRIEIKGKDTCAVVPIKQMRIANAKFIELKACKEENDSLFSEIRTYTGMVNNLQSSITDLKQAGKLNESIISDKQKIIDISDKELKKTTRKTKILRAERNTMAAAVLIAIVKIFIFK